MDLDLSWYLTGGTALSRFYFHHRYSDDLDFFLNDDPNYSFKVQKAILELKKKGFQILDKTYPGSEFFSNYILKYGDTELKIDFVNDIPNRQKQPIMKNNISIDSIENILTNKISAIYRFAAKDVADLWIISKNFRFDWVTAFQFASQKVMGIELSGVGKLFFTIPSNIKDEIRWTSSLDPESFLNDIQIMGQDILSGNTNSLANKEHPLLTFL